jgi:hypothetical protein
MAADKKIVIDTDPNGPSLNDRLQSHLPDAGMQAAPRALLRAAQRAREVARRTNTPLVVVRDGVLVHEMVGPEDSPSLASKILPELEGFREK